MKGLALLSLLAALAACAEAVPPSSDAAGGAPPVGAPSAPTEPPPAPTTPAPDPASPTAPDPFAPQPDTSQGLHNVSSDLSLVLEHGILEDACDLYAEDPTHPKKRLLCGKRMFFYEGFGTIGVPEAVFDVVADELEDEVGPAYENYGLIPDPIRLGRPIGVGAGANLRDDVPTLAFTCASCHFAQLPDGRYAVGAPNHDYEYGKHLLALMVAPMAAQPGFSPADHHPDAIAAVQPLIDRIQGNLGVQLSMGIALFPLLGIADEAPTLTFEAEGQHAAWKSGTMDFMIAPLPMDDGVHTVSKITALYGIPTPKETSDSGMVHGMLAWTGGTTNLENFVRAFVKYGHGDLATWTDERLGPLVDYIHTLRPPSPPAAPTAEVSHGEAVFTSAGCIGCHDGPRGSGKTLYSYDAIGTDPAMKAWGDADLDGVPCCGLSLDDTLVTHELKSPRLVGLWGMTRFLHNGAVDSLEALLCLDGPRPTITTPAMSDAGHTYGCDLSEADRHALVAFLESH